jgi:hypothetical protein
MKMAVVAFVLALITAIPAHRDASSRLRDQRQSHRWLCFQHVDFGKCIRDKQPDAARSRARSSWCIGFLRIQRLVQWRRVAFAGTWIQTDKVQQMVLSKMGYQGHGGAMTGLKTESHPAIGIRS